MKEWITLSTSFQTPVPLHQAPQARPSTVPQVFRAAARLLVVNGHWQGDYLPDPFDRYVKTPHASRPLSIVAALRCVVSGDPHQRMPLSDAAVLTLAHRLLVEGEEPANDEPETVAGHVNAWGDLEGRTTESAVAVLEAAADANAVAA